MRLGVLVSGKLGNSVLEHLNKKNEVVFVMTDRNSEDIINFCKKKQLLLFIGNPRNGNCKSFIENQKIEILVSVNYLFIIEGDIIELPTKLAFNIHGSLLPKYRGRTPHVWAIINNEKKTGITAHIIDNGCDTGDIIEQISIPIAPNDTGFTILEKFQRLYIPLLDTILQKIKNNKLQLTPQNHSSASYFGKRTPSDGKIDWNWQQERINNWIRAQTFPYPGAFTFYKDQKIIIDKIKFMDFTFNFEIPNGEILSTMPLLVKTPNGVIELQKLRDNTIQFEIGEQLK